MHCGNVASGLPSWIGGFHWHYRVQVVRLVVRFRQLRLWVGTQARRGLPLWFLCLLEVLKLFPFGAPCAKLVSASMEACLVGWVAMDVVLRASALHWSPIVYIVFVWTKEAIWLSRSSLPNILSPRTSAVFQLWVCYPRADWAFLQRRPSGSHKECRVPRQCASEYIPHSAQWVLQLRSIA